MVDTFNETQQAIMRLIGPLTLPTSGDLQTALNTVSANGGGFLYLLPGTYTLTKDIVIPSSVQIIGAGPTSTIIYGGGLYQISTASTSLYTTGTVVNVTTAGVVTGSGTSWLANASAGEHIFLGTRWYLIAAVPADDTIILGEGYGDNVTMPATYRIAYINTDVALKELAITTCTVPLAALDCRRLILENVQMYLNSSGPTFRNVSEFRATAADSAANTGDGITFNNVGLGSFETFASAGNTGNGLTLTNVKTFAFNQMALAANTVYGISATGCTDLQFYVTASGNGSIGINLLANNDTVRIYNTDCVANTGDGIKLSASSNNTIISLSKFTFNGPYGINIANSTCGSTIITTSIASMNGSGSINNLGTNTLIRSNQGITDYP